MPAARPHFVVVDTETTGLDPLTDHIIDVGAVRLDEGLAVVDRFTTLVDPGVPVPLFVSRLTGITDADLAGAPVRRRGPRAGCASSPATHCSSATTGIVDAFRVGFPRP